jgi:prophage DNA circulation protein
MTDDLPEVVTRKVGPLPAWGWVAAIVGAYVVYRVFSGGSQSGTATVVGSSPAATDTGDGDTGDDIFTGSSSLVQQIQTRVGELNTAQMLVETKVGQLGSVQTLLTQLTGLLNQRSSLLNTKATALERRNYWQDALRTCRTTACKTKAKSRIAEFNKKATDADKALAALNTKIADLQKKIGAANG